jgi:membrane-bound metal-dependent hydrolase YbcI (DUF457 family)
MGRTHATAGAAAGAAWAEYIAHLSLPGTIVLAGLTAGAAVLPDVDHPNSTMAHSFGFLTKLIATVIGKVSGGHRKLTHSLLGIGLFWLAAAAGVHYRHDMAGRIGLCVLLTLILASGLCIVPKLHSHITDAAAVVLAIWMTVAGLGLAFTALAVVVGAACHVGVDMLTDKGCPLLLPVSPRHFRLWPEPLAFTTQTRPETAALIVFTGTLAYLGVHAITLTPHVL